MNATRSNVPFTYVEAPGALCPALCASAFSITASCITSKVCFHQVFIDQVNLSSVAKVIYYPHFGRVLASSNLLIPTSGRSEDGEVWDGLEEIEPQHPNYNEWSEAISNKEFYFRKMKDERRRAREERRGNRRNALGGNTPEENGEEKTI